MNHSTQLVHCKRIIIYSIFIINEKTHLQWILYVIYWLRGDKRNTLGERVYYVRKSKGYTQDSLAESIGVSRGIIFNLEKNKTQPQLIVINAICQTLNINKEWLVNGIGEMEDTHEASQSTKKLTELYEVAK